MFTMPTECVETTGLNREQLEDLRSFLLALTGGNLLQLQTDGRSTTIGDTLNTRELQRQSPDHCYISSKISMIRKCKKGRIPECLSAESFKRRASVRSWRFLWYIIG